MNKIDLFQLYELGSALADIRNAPSSPKGLFLPVIRASVCIRALIANDSLGLGISKRPAELLVKTLDELNKAVFVDEKGDFSIPDNDAVFPELMLSKAKREARDLETVLRAELNSLATYAALKRPGVNTSDMVECAEKTIPASLHLYVGSTALEEFNSAGRCLAFGLYTAAGYHVCRAIEAMTENYFFVCSDKRKPLKSWNEYVKALTDLREKGKPLPSARAIRALQQLKDLDRNQLMHPRAVLNEIDADLLWSVGRAAVIQMALEMKEHQPSHGTPSGILGLGRGGLAFHDTGKVAGLLELDTPDADNDPPLTS
jgi:hypothetical protein